MPLNKDPRTERGVATPRSASGSEAHLRPPSPLPPGLQRLMRWVMLMGWVVPTALFPLIALFAPLEVLDRWPDLAKACAAVKAALGQLFPKVDFFRHARSTAFPQVATVATAYTAIAWVWMTGATLLVSLVTQSGGRTTLRRMGAKRVLGLSVAFPVFALGCLFVFFSLPGDPSFAKGLTTNGRGGYAFMGTCALGFGSLGIGLWPLVICTLIFDVFFGGRKQHG